VSIYLDEFNGLLADERFWENDVFQNAEGVATRLDADDWTSIIASWNQKTEQDRENLFATLGDVTHPSLVRFAFTLLNAPDADKISEGLAILSFASPKIGQYISGSDMETLAAVWRENPNYRIGLQQTLWSKGKSGELRRLLSLERWSDVGK
jgi:hypothetical protein